MSQKLEEQEQKALSYLEELRKARAERAARAENKAPLVPAPATATDSKAQAPTSALSFLEQVDQALVAAGSTATIAAAGHKAYISGDNVPSLKPSAVAASAAESELEPEILAALYASQQEMAARKQGRAKDSSQPIIGGSTKRNGLITAFPESGLESDSKRFCASINEIKSEAEHSPIKRRRVYPKKDKTKPLSESKSSLAGSSASAPQDKENGLTDLAELKPMAKDELRAKAALALGLTQDAAATKAAPKVKTKHAAAASSAATTAFGKWHVPLRTQEELSALALRYRKLSGSKLEEVRREETYQLLLELNALIINDTTYARYCAKMKAMGLEPLARATLWQFNIAYVFGQGGLLSHQLPHYRPRPGQISLARHVASAMGSGQILMVEAGTGTGKTFSYLVPPIIAGKRVLVSTGTKALQDQLISKDIPNLTKMLGLPHHHHIALKGQANYICRYLMEGRGMSQLMAREAQLLNAYVIKSADQIDHNRYQATFGEINFPINDAMRSCIACDSSLCQEMSGLCPYAKLKWQFLKSCGASEEEAKGVVKPGAGVESTTASISGLEITSGPTYHPDALPDVTGDHCFVFAARHEAKKRQIVAINHALFFGALQSPNGFNSVNSILPWPEVLVFDEAHTLPEVGRSFFTRHVSLRELTELPDTIRTAFKDTSISVDSGAFQEVNFKYSLLVRTLLLGLSVYEADKRNVLDFKYRHSKYPSSFELLGPCLVHPRERGFLGKDSYLSKLLKSLESSSHFHSASFFESLGIESKDLADSLSSLGIKGLSALAEKDETSTKDERFSGSSHLSSQEQRVLEQAIARRYVELITPLMSRFGERSSFMRPKSELKPCLVPPGDKPFDDVLRDEQGHPVVEPFFRALMADLLLALRSISELLESNKEASEHVPTVLERIKELIAFVTDFMTSDRNKKGEQQWENAAWIEINGGQEDKRTGHKRDYSYVMVVAPIDIGKYLGEALRKLRDNGTTIVFASATITVNQEFTKFCHDIGLKESEVKTAIVPSPFDYEHHACLLSSPSFPPTNDSKRITQCVAMVKEAIDCVDGGVFFLTTSYSMMNAAAKELSAIFAPRRKVLVQGQAAVPRLMDEFRKDGQAILVGTSSFWEGVDVPGKALSLVIIDKLPFKTIGDPMQVARAELCAHRGGNYFTDISMPEAIIMLRQGVGRLIRNEEDSGALIILDPRLHVGRYGPIFFNSLPPMKKVTTIGELTSFLQQVKKSRKA